MNLTTAIISILAAALICLMIYTHRAWFVWNDVTTTPDDPPQYERLVSVEANKDRDMTYSQAKGYWNKVYYPDIKPLDVPHDPATTFLMVQKLAKSMPGWEIAHINPSAMRLEAVAKTALMKYEDDVVLEVRPGPRGATVHMRSKSRLGTGDFGTNARRIQDFFALFNGA